MNKYPTDSKIHNSFRAMRARCNNPHNNRYQNYGLRGIKVCDEWSSYDAFYEWAMSNGWEEGLSLDRIDVNGNYEPSNCRWVDTKTQCNNTRANRKVTINGITKNICEWCDFYGINRKTVYSRLKYGLEVVDAITRPVDKRKGVKDKDCLHCKKFFECNGKPERRVPCVNFEERKEDKDYGRS